jgi:hypothetical protein
MSLLPPIDRTKLPKEFNGYPVDTLLQTWEDLLADKLRKNPVSDEQFRAMDHLIRDYKLSPIFQKPATK